MMDVGIIGINLFNSTFLFYFIKCNSPFPFLFLFFPYLFTYLLNEKVVTIFYLTYAVSLLLLYIFFGRNRAPTLFMLKKH
jgi:hypothetical protein